MNQQQHYNGNQTHGGGKDVWMSPERTRNVLAPTRVAPAGTPVAAMPPQNQKKKRPRMKDLFYDYTQNTTVHGISYITASGHFILRKLIWFLMVAAVLSFLVYYIHGRVVFFLERPRNVNVEITYPTQVAFPSITVCNENAFKITPAVDNGWYDLVKNLTTVSTASSDLRDCGEFECGGLCLPIYKRCDVFPDCPKGEDEQNCKDLCRLLKATGPPSALTWINTDPAVFDLQPPTYDQGSDLYISYGGSADNQLYLYHHENEWRIGDEYRGGNVYAYIPDSTGVPPHTVQGEYWRARDENGDFSQASIGFKLKCEKRYEDLLVDPPVEPVTDLPLTTLYEKTAQKQQDFIQSCLWKGDKCNDTFVKKTWTKMGICYTFGGNSTFVEQSGPGYGLGLTLNIEEYEYSKSTDDGIGIKVLMHDTGDVPMMASKGLAVSPGLYSFLSLESTRIESLEAPYGTCESSELDYFDSYSTAKCTVECEENILMDKCGCRHIHMPHSGGEPEVCDVQQYLACAKAALDDIQKNSDSCVCGSPCNSSSYAPSLSFATVIGSEGGTNTAEEEAQRQKLAAARETTYRVVKANYMGTLRMFHFLLYQLRAIRSFSVVLGTQLEQEAEFVFSKMNDVRGDCVYTKNAIRNTSSLFKTKVSPPLKQTASFFQLGLLKDLTAMNFAMEAAIEDYQAYLDNLTYGMDYFDDNVTDMMTTDMMTTVGTADYNFTMETPVLEWPPPLSRSLARKNDSSWNTYVSMSSTLLHLQEYVYARMAAEINSSILNTTTIELDEATLGPLAALSGFQCGWCNFSEGAPLSVVAFDRISIDTADDGIIMDFRNLTTALDEFYYDCMKDLKVTNSSGEETILVEDCRWMLGNISAKTEETLLRTVALGDDMDELTSGLDLLEDYIWSVSCQNELGRMSSDYNRYHVSVLETLGSMTEYTTTQISHIEMVLKNYTEEINTLETSAHAIPFDELISQISSKSAEVDSSLLQRQLIMSQTESQIEAIYKQIRVVIDDEILMSTSTYMEGNPKSSNNDTSTTLEGDPLSSNNDTITEDENSTLSIGADEPVFILASFWSDLKDDIAYSRVSLITQNELLVKTVSESSVYFNDYLDGNQINARYFDKNFLKVELYYKELSEQSISQLKGYVFQDLLGDIGGLMGLLIGASVISIAELIDFFLFNVLGYPCK